MNPRRALILLPVSRRRLDRANARVVRLIDESADHLAFARGWMDVATQLREQHDRVAQERDRAHRQLDSVIALHADTYQSFSGLDLLCDECRMPAPCPTLRAARAARADDATEEPLVTALPPCPDCRDGKHAACVGRTWNDTAGQYADCPCQHDGADS